MTKYIILFGAVAVVCSLVKLLFWLQIKQRRAGGFVNSFFRYYSSMDLHDSSSAASERFKKLSNYLNFIFWGSIIFIIMYILFNFESLFSNEVNPNVPTENQSWL